MSLFATGLLSIFVGITSVFVGIMDYCFPDEYTTGWYIILFNNQIRTYKALIALGIFFISIGIVCLIVRFIKILKAKKHRHKRHHHRKHKSGKSTHRNHRPKMKSLAELSVRYCPNCNNRLFPSSRFCNICGTKMEDAEEEETTTQTES